MKGKVFNQLRTTILSTKRIIITILILVCYCCAPPENEEIRGIPPPANTLKKESVQVNKSISSRTKNVGNCYKINLNFLAGVNISDNEIAIIIEGLNQYATLLNMQHCFVLDTINRDFPMPSDLWHYFTSLSFSNTKTIYFLVKPGNNPESIHFYDNHIKLDEIDFKNIIIDMHEIYHAIWKSLFGHISYDDHKIHNDIKLKDGQACNNLFAEGNHNFGALITKCQSEWINDFVNEPYNYNQPPYSYDCCPNNNCIIENVYPVEFIQQYPYETDVCCTFNLGLSEETMEELIEDAEEYFNSFNSNPAEYLDLIFFNDFLLAFYSAITPTCFILLNEEQIEELAAQKSSRKIRYPDELPVDQRLNYRRSLLYAASYLHKKEHLSRGIKKFEIESKFIYPDNKEKQRFYVKSRVDSQMKNVNKHKAAFFKSLYAWTKEMPERKLQEKPKFEKLVPLIDSLKGGK